MPDGFDPATFDPHDPAFLRDPYPTYAEFRAHEPIHWSEQYRAYWLFNYADCLAVLNGTAVWMKSPKGAPPPPGSANGPYGLMTSCFPAGMFDSDPPKHERIRAAVEPPFHEEITKAEAIAQAIATESLGRAAERDWFELISEYALPLPAGVLFKLIGIPDQPEHPGVWEILIAYQAIIAAAHDITQSPQLRLQGATASMAVVAMFEAMLHEKPANESLFGKVQRAFKKSNLSETPKLTKRDVQIWARDFVVAGYLSTTYLIGNGTRNLLANPGQLKLLREDLDGRMPGAIAEMMRYDGPVQIIDRMAAEDTEVGGRKFKQYEKVMVVVGSANRDGKTFKEDPDAFLIGRDAAEADAQLGFGWGIHECIGKPLVDIVAPVAFRMLLEKFPNLGLAGEPQWQTDPYLRAVTNLPLHG